MNTYSKHLIESFFIMLFCILISIVSAMSIGVGVDQIHDVLVCADMYNLGGSWKFYEPQSSHDAQFFITMVHVVIYTLPIIGVTNFIISATRKLRYDLYEEEEEYVTY